MSGPKACEISVDYGGRKWCKTHYRWAQPEQREGWCVVPKADMSPYISVTSKWDKRFLEMAKLVSGWSKDPSTKTGAVIVDPLKRVVSVGYNGFPRGVEDSDDRYLDRDLKLKLIVHCERNAILFAERALKGCTLYNHPFMSCAPCAAMVIQSGITRVVAPLSDNPRWRDDFKLAQIMFEEAGVEVVLAPSQPTSSDSGTQLQPAARHSTVEQEG